MGKHNYTIGNSWKTFCSWNVYRQCLEINAKLQHWFPMFNDHVLLELILPDRYVLETS